MVSRLVNELGEAFPTLKEVVIDERDTWIGEAVKAVPGGRLVVVIGAGHLDGVERTLLAEEAVSTAPLAEIPPPGKTGRIIGFAIPAIILGALAWTWAVRGAEAASDGALFWIAVNSIPAAFGAVLALAHPLTILAAFLCAPFTSLTPVVGTGYVTAFVQAWVRPPRVFELRELKADALVPRALVPEPGAPDRAGADPADHREYLRDVRGRVEADQRGAGGVGEPAESGGVARSLPCGERCRSGDPAFRAACAMCGTSGCAARPWGERRRPLKTGAPRQRPA